MAAGEECLVGDVLVKTGDWIFGDATGIIVLPEAKAQEAVARALEILEAEASLDRRLSTGEPLFSVLEKSGHI